MRAPVFLALLCAAGTAHALDVSDTSRFVCKQGNCMNGPGTVWDAALSVNMHGNWRNGQTIPGATYTLTLPIAPGRQFRQVYGTDGMLESGDSPRSLGVINGVVPFFRGSYGRITHAFLRQPVAVIKQGVYDTDIGIEYHGRFEYLAGKSSMNSGWGSGYYIFYGDKIDTEEDEKESGLFVSDETPGGAAVRFVKADPSYLAVLQRKYQSDMAIAQGEFQQQESEKKWRSALSVIGNVAFALAAGGGSMGGGSDLSGNMALGLMGGGGGLGGAGGLDALGALAGSSGAGGSGSDLAGSIAMGLVAGMFNQGGSNVSVNDLAAQAIGSAVGGDNRQLSSALIGMVTQGMTDGGGNAPSTAPGTGGSTAADVFAGAMINRTTNVIASAAGKGSGSSIGSQIGTALLKQALAPAAAAAPADMDVQAAIAKQRIPLGDTAADPGTVQLPYTPGKGFLDPVTGKYIKTMEEMSCDNVTSRGVKIRDLPPDQRACVETGPSGIKTRITPPAQTPVPAPIPAPVSAPAPAPAPAAPTGKKAKASGVRATGAVGVIPPSYGLIAQLDKIDPPDGTSLSGDRMYATNDGVYLAVSGADGRTVVAKRTLGRGNPARWITATLPKGSASFAVSSLADEGIDEFGIHWATYMNRYGYTNMNNRGTSVDYKNGGARIFIPIGAKSTMGRNWAIGEFSEIYLQNSGGGHSTDFPDRYTEISWPDKPPLYKDLGITDEEGTTLYVAASDLKTLIGITINKDISRHDLSAFGNAHIHTLIAAHGKIWIGYGDRILTLANGKIEPFITLPNIFSTTRPSFCMAGPNMYTADGQVLYGIDTSSSQPRSFLQSGAQVRPEDLLPLSEMKSALLGGLYCSNSPGYGPVIHALGMDMTSGQRKLFAIRPR